MCTVSGDRLYWCDASTDRVESSDLDGQNRTVLVDDLSVNIHPFDIAVYYGRIYWTDWKSRAVRIDEGINGISEYGSSIFAKAGGIHIYKGEATSSDAET